MITKNKLLLLLAWLLMVNANAQTSTPTSLYLVAKPNSPLPSCPTCSLTVNTTFNNILSSFGVTSFQKVFQGATNETLSKTYRIKATGNLVSLKAAIDNSQFFTLTELGYSGQSLGTASATYPNGCSNPQAVNDEWITQGWTNDNALEMSDAYCAWTLTHGNPSLKIAVIDEPINPSHPDFKDASGAFKVTVKSMFNPIPTHDSHGTRVTGVICAQTNNNTFTASIGHDLRVNHYSYDPFSDIPLLIWDAYQFGNKVINISNVINYNSIEIIAIKEVIEGGCVIVAGAGNAPGGYRQGVNTWNIPGFIIVSGVGPDNKHSTPCVNNVRTDEYTGVDLCALSNGVSTTDMLSGVFTVRDGWGTSFAAPQVAAVVGLMLSVNPCLTPAEIDGILKSTTDPIADANLFPGKIGTGRLNAYKAVLKAQNYGSSNLVVNSGEVKTIQWLDYYEKITVNNGGVLNILNTTLYMAQDGRINVNVGGKLNITNSKVMAREPFNGCDFPRYVWNGISVAGSPSLDQMPVSNQGYVVVTGSTIQDARNAISTYLVDASNNIIWNKTGGGIIQTRNSVFRRNGRHIEFYGYNRVKNQNNLSSFSDTKFEYEGSVDVASGNRPYFMITAYGVRGVKFTGCTFVNVNGSVNADLYGYDRGTGIYTFDASFVVAETQNMFDCSTISQGSFTDLSYGLKLVYSPSATYSSRVKKQAFRKNDKAIYLSNGLATAIDHNTFDLNVPSNYFNRRASVSDPTYKSGIVGVYAPKASGYRIEQNSFVQPSTKVNKQVIIGFVPDQSDAAGGGGYYRLNTLNNTNIGAQTQSHNGSLEISCNEYTNTETAINLNPLSIGSVLPSFSRCGDPWMVKQEDYENTFIQNNTDLYKASLTGTNSFHPYVIRNGASNRPDPLKCYKVGVTNCVAYPANNTIAKNCAPFEQLKEACNRVVIGIGVGNEKLKFQTAKRDYIDIKTRIEYGKSTNLIQLVQQGSAIPAASLYGTLMSSSPYLSDEVLLQMLMHSTHLSEQQLVAVLIANAGLSETVWQSVLLVGFSQGSFTQLEDIQQSTTLASESNEANLLYYETQMVNTRNDVILKANLLQLEEPAEHDEIVVNYIDSIIYFLREEDDIDSRKQLIATYYLAGMYQNAKQALLLLPRNTDEETDNFITYYSLILNAYLDSRNVYLLDENEWSILTDLSLSETTAGYAAKGLLGLVRGAYFEDYIERLDGQEEYGKTGIGESNALKAKTSLALIVYPNPATQQFVAQFRMSANSKNVKLKVIDITGKVVYTDELKSSIGSVSVSSAEWETGLYFVQVFEGDRLIETQKLVIGK